MADDRRPRVWPQRVSAVATWLFVLPLVLVTLVDRWYLTVPLAVLLSWLAVGTWKGRRDQAVALVVLGGVGAVWFAYRTGYSATWSEMSTFRPDGRLMELRQPVARTVAIGVMAILTSIVALGALPLALRSAPATRDDPEVSRALEA